MPLKAIWNKVKENPAETVVLGGAGVLFTVGAPLGGLLALGALASVKLKDAMFDWMGPPIQPLSDEERTPDGP